MAGIQVIPAKVFRYINDGPVVLDKNEVSREGPQAG